MILFSVVFRGFLGRISIFLGVVVGYIVAVIAGEVDFSAVEKAAWVGLPEFQFADFASPGTWSVIAMFLPVVLVLIAENVGHVRGVATMTDASINRHTGRALIADGAATTLAGAFGGSGTTTYGENIGVMAATRVYSTAAYWVAGVVAIVLALSPKVGAVFNSIPPGVLGGVTTALYGLIGIIGIKIWVDNRVDFSRPVNQYTGAVSLVIAIAGFTMQWGELPARRDRHRRRRRTADLSRGQRDRPLAQDRRRRRRPDPCGRSDRRQPPGRARVARTAAYAPGLGRVSSVGAQNLRPNGARAPNPAARALRGGARGNGERSAVVVHSYE